MDSIDLNHSSYWESDAVDLRVHPRRPLDTGGLLEFLQKKRDIRASVVLPTSGTSGGAKFVVLTKAALLASATAVNAHFDIRSQDRWLAGLADFHVGGLGIHARAYLSGSKVVSIPWDSWGGHGREFVRALSEQKITHTSLTPTHLHDLVRLSVMAPSDLRVLLLGGGRIDQTLSTAARALGWPVRASYGMTEAASQVATAIDDEIKHLPILPIWETRTTEDGSLALRGPALFTGYAEKIEETWTFRPAKDPDGWFVTGDRCFLDDGKLCFLERADALVKISGELVSLTALEELASAMAKEHGAQAAVITIPDERREHALVLCIDAGNIESHSFLKSINHRLSGIEQIREICHVPEIPRTALGKVDRALLEEWVRRNLRLS
jgi:o-succinylbenzoate---CoA ligase